MVMLVPARTDTKWWHEIIRALGCGDSLLLRGRLRFGNSIHPAPPFPCAVVVFRPGKLYRCTWCEKPFRPAQN